MHRAERSTDAPPRLAQAIGLVALALMTPDAAVAQSERDATLGSEVRLSEASEPTQQAELRRRAASLRPVGMSAGRLVWDSTLTTFAGETHASHLPTHEGLARVAVDSLLVQASYSLLLHFATAVRRDRGVPPFEDSVVVARTGTPEFTASFRDTPATGWRYEVGGAVAVPVTSETWLDGPEPPLRSSGAPALPLDNLFRWRGLGWDGYRMLDQIMTVIASARAEWDALRELVLALEVDVPVLVSFDGQVDVYPQVALDVAGRFMEHQLVGVRAELTSYGRSAHGVNVLLEPFARFLLFHPNAAPFARLALRLPIGPTYPLAGLDVVGFIGGSISLGVLY